MIGALNTEEPAGGASSRRRSITALLMLVLLGLGQAACTAGPATRTPVLDVSPEALRWPAPPERARYALVGLLTGERDFLDPDQPARSNLDVAMRWIAGLAFGEPEYRELRRPVAGVTDENGSIYVTDMAHKAVVAFNFKENQLQFWKWAAFGTGFVAPVGIVADEAGGFLVTDAELAVVVRLDSEGQPRGQFGQGLLTRPTGIARDPVTGTIYVADTAAHDIKVFDAQGGLMETLGGPGVDAGRFNGPSHLLFHDGALIVADTLNFRVQLLNRGGGMRQSIGRLGLYVGDLTRPKGVAVGGEGRIYVVESYYDHLLVFDPSGRLLLPIGGTGAENGKFYLPAGVWTDSFGRVYVADMFNGRIVVLMELTEVSGTE